MDEIQLNRVLPQELVINGAESHLYRIGLSLYKTGSVKRKWFYNPILVFIITFQLFVRNIMFLLPELAMSFTSIWVDVGYLIDARIQANILTVIAIMISISFKSYII